MSSEGLLALSTLRPPVRTDTVEAERLGPTARRVRVAREKGGSLRPGKKTAKDRAKREKKRRRVGLGVQKGVVVVVVGASVASAPG